MATHFEWFERWQAQSKAAVSLESLETGGWIVTIDSGMKLHSLNLLNRRTDAQWISSSVTHGVFKGAGSSLEEILGVFRSWLEAEKKERVND